MNLVAKAAIIVAVYPSLLVVLTWVAEFWLRGGGRPEHYAGVYARRFGGAWTQKEKRNASL